jgi:hypothetical protein
MHVLKLVAVERNIVLLRPVRRYCGTILCPEISKGIDIQEFITKMHLIRASLKFNGQQDR